MPHSILMPPRAACAVVLALVPLLAPAVARADGAWNGASERPPRLGQFSQTAPNGNGINYLLPPGQKAVPWNEPASQQMQQMGERLPVSAEPSDIDACTRKYPSYDPASGLYRAENGRWKPCP